MVSAAVAAGSADPHPSSRPPFPGGDVVRHTVRAIAVPMFTDAPPMPTPPLSPTPAPIRTAADTSLTAAAGPAPETAPPRATRIWELPTSLAPGQYDGLPAEDRGAFDAVTFVDLPAGAAFAPMHKVGWQLRQWRRGQGSLAAVVRGFLHESFASWGRLLGERQLRNNLAKLASVPDDRPKVLHLGAQMRSRAEIRRRVAVALERGVNEFMVLSGGGLWQQFTKAWRTKPIVRWTWRPLGRPLTRLAGRLDAVGVLEELGRMRAVGKLPEHIGISIVCNPNRRDNAGELASLRRKADAIRAFNPDFANVRLYAQPTMYVLRPAVDADTGTPVWEVDPGEAAACHAFYETAYRELLPANAELIIGLPSFASPYQVDFWSFLVGRDDATTRNFYDVFAAAHDPKDKSAFLALRKAWNDAAVTFGLDLAIGLGLPKYGFIFQPATRSLTTKTMRSALDRLDVLENAQSDNL